MEDKIIDKVNILKEKGILDDNQSMTLRRGLSANRSFASIVLHIFITILDRLDKLEAKKENKIKKDLDKDKQE